MDVTLELESAHDARCNPVWRNAFFVFLPQRVFCAPFTALWRRQAKRRARMIGASATAKVTCRPFATLCAAADACVVYRGHALAPATGCRPGPPRVARLFTRAVRAINAQQQVQSPL